MRIGEAAIGGGGDAEFGAEILREGLRAFELRRLPCSGPKALMPAALEIVDEARDEGRFGPDHHEVDRHGAAEVDHGAMIRHVEHHIRAVLRGAWIAGGDEEPVAERARRKAPGQSMFAARRSR